MTFARHRIIALIPVVIGLAIPSSSSAFGISHNAGGRLIEAGYSTPEGISDGAGGLIVAARDSSTGSVNVNRFDAMAAPMWSQGISYQSTSGLTLESDGSGGAIIAVNTDTQMIVGRILHSGATTWQRTFPNGVLASSGDGGAWVVIEQGALIAQGVASDGTTRPEVQLAPESDSPSLPAVSEDGSGGTYLSWRVARSDGTFGLDLQHLSSSGTLWSNPVMVAGTTQSGVLPTLAPDGSGGVLVSWYASALYWVVDYRSDGTSKWNNAITVATSAADRAYAAADGTGGVFLTYLTRTSSLPFANDNINESYITATGTLQWSDIVASVKGGVLQMRVAPQYAAVVIGWQSAQVPIIGPAIDTDLSIQRVTSDDERSYLSTSLASSLGPDSFGSLADAGNGTIDAVFTQAPCFQSSASGVAMQRIDADGTREFQADGACP
ncbi:MAG: hypothetical protein ACYDCC_01850 [Actinomycetota bacterium]